MGKRHVTNHSDEFKKSSVKFVVDSNQPVSRTAVELGVHPSTLHG